MSTVINPVGPEEPSTYWRRRAIVVVALLVVLWLAWWLLGALFGGDDTAADGPGAGPTVGLSISPEPEGSGDPSGEPSEGVSGSPGASASAACADDVITVTAATDAATAAVGAGMGLTMTVTNNGDAACSRDVGAGANELQVTSGSVLVWSSDFCNDSDATDVQTLEPGQSWSTSITWPGTIVAKDCPADQPNAQAGGYKASARNGEVDSEQVAFTVQ